MPARAPLDVDLEDKLLYGLTPMRLGYVLLALLGGFALWSSRWAAEPIRAGACLVVIGAGATFAWGRWRGRAVDGWLIDAAAFLTRTRRIVWDEHWVAGLKWRLWPSVSTSAPTGGFDSGEEPTIAESVPEARDADAIDYTTGVAFPDAVVATG